MKILHTVEFYHPSVGGMQEVVRQLSERLARSGHDVTVATSRLPGRSKREYRGVRIAEFSVFGNLALGMSGELDEFRKFVLNGGFDVVTNFAAQQWSTDALLPVLKHINGAKVFVPTGFSALHDPTYRDYFASMKEWMRQYDVNVFLSESYRDVEFARACNVKNMITIPNGAAEDEFLAKPEVDIRTRLGIPRNHLLILNVGSHTHAKGHAESISVFAKAQIRNATLLLVANDVEGGCSNSCRSTEARSRFRPSWYFAGKRLLVRSLSRTETIAAFHAADLLLFTSQIECSPLVLFEAMASRTPFLATDVGNVAEIIQWSDGGELLPTSFDSLGFGRVEVTAAAEILERLAADASRREELAAAGFSAWCKNFTWERIALQYEAMYRSLLRGKPAMNRRPGGAV